jgi:hypothetical protein
MGKNPIPWLMESAEPWIRYRTLVDLLDQPGSDPAVQAARAQMLAHPQVQRLLAHAAEWPGHALKRHNDASHPIHAFSTLADFGLRAEHPPMSEALDAVLAHQAPEGAFQTLVNVSKSFGGTGEDAWSWMLCDAPVLLYSLLAMDLGEDVRIGRAVAHLLDLVDENGWRCVVASELGKFRGPGRKADPCPIANLYALKALAQVPDLLDSPATRTGAEMLLWHWEHQKERKIYMFGIGTDFRKLKYPFIWYDILHVVDVLSRFPFVLDDARFRQMVETITAQADPNRRHTPSSMYRHWKDWPFADKKNPSPWLTLLVLRIQKRLDALS